MLTMKHQILIIGGGNAGISIASQLLAKDSSLDIAIVDGSEKHYYQPAWTLVGGGAFNIEDTVRDEEDVMPKGVKWIKAFADKIDAKNNKITLDNKDIVEYEYLIAAPGIQCNWGEIKGLEETLGKNGVTSNYRFDLAPYTYKCIQNTKNGLAVFTQPNTPIKCGGAPMKIMFLASDYFRKNKSGNKVQFMSGGGRIFGVDKYEKQLKKIIERYQISPTLNVKMTEIDGKNKVATFIGFGDGNKDKEYKVKFDMIHVTPPQSAPDFIKESPLANEAGWIDVDKNSLQHTKFPNVFAAGDVAGIPVSRTGAAIRKQAPILVENLLAVMRGNMADHSYDGYSSCPIVTGYGKLILAEFDYTNTPKETFPFDQSKERWTMWVLKKYLLPFFYWTRILPGKM